MKAKNQSENLMQNANPEIIICLPSFNEKNTIANVTKQVDAGLRFFYDPKKCLILNIDSDSEDNTRSIFLNTPTICPKRTIRIKSRPRGKGRNLLRLFEEAVKHKVRAVATIDTDIQTVRQDWVELLIKPIINQKADFVTPLYSRNRFDATITNHFAFPLVYALFSQAVRQPIGGEFGLSRKLCAYLLKQPRVKTMLFYGIDIFMSIHALGGGFRICETYLGRKLHNPSYPKLLPMFLQVSNSALFSAQKYMQNKNKKRAKFIPARMVNIIDRESVFLNRKDIPMLLDQITKEYLDFKNDYKKVLGPTFNKLDSLVKTGNPKLSTELWTDLLATFFSHYHKAPTIKRLYRVSRLLTPLYVWRSVTFWRKIEKLSALKIQNLLNQQAEMLRLKLAFRK